MKCCDNCGKQETCDCPLTFVLEMWDFSKRSCDLYTPKPGRIEPGVIKFGDLVKIKLLELNGYITAICYRGEAVTYEVSYFSNGEYSQKWVEEFEIEEAK